MKKINLKDNLGVIVIEIMLQLTLTAITILLPIAILAEPSHNGIHHNEHFRYSCDEIKKITTVNHYKTGNSDISIEDMKIYKKQCNIDD